MNKRFSTLMAAALVAGGMSASAQVAGTVATKLVSNPARNYMLTTTTFATPGNIGTVIAVDGKEAKTITANATEVNKQLWTIKVTTVAGSNRFVLVNKANGTTLSFDPKTAVAANASGAVTAPAAGSKAFSLEEVSSDTEWTWVTAANATAELDDVVALTSAFRGDSTMAVAVDGNKLYAYKYANNNVPTVATQLKLQAVQPGTIYMTPDLLNVLGEVPASKYFTLSTNKAGLIDADQLIDRKFHAVRGTTPNSVQLQNLKADGTLDNKYAYVDTAFHVGTGTNLDVWYKFANTKTAGSFNFLQLSAKDFFIQMDLYRDSVIVSVPQTSLTEKSNAAAANGSFWQNSQSNTTLQGYTTVSAIKLTPTTEVLTLYAVPNAEKLLFSVSSPEADKTLTTVADGVYTIKNEKGQYLAVPVYNASTDFNSYPTWVTVNKDEQNVEHMPAYQWVVLKDKVAGKGSETSTVTLTNREFAKKMVWNGTADVIVDNSTTGVQLRQKEGGEFLYTGTRVALFNSADSLEFKAIDEAVLGDTLLGYKNLDANDLKVNRYTFNYMHAYTLEKYIAKSTKDSLATVLDGKAIFAIEAVGAIEAYGYDVTKAGTRIAGLKQLERQAYTMSIPAVKKANLGVNTEDKYAISSNLGASTFFFKENNDLKGDDDCYHALIEIGYWSNDGIKYYSKAGVSDDDLSATLKNIVSSETRTSAFYIAPYDAPLYRRFNSAELEGNAGNAGDAADTLRFKEKYRGEYLQVENNDNFMVDGVKFLGIYTPDFTKDGKSFIVDTAFVDRYNGNIKPQYLVSINRDDAAIIKGVPCTYEHNHYDNAGNKVDKEHCSHATQDKPGFQFGEYLVNFQDSVEYAASKAITKDDYAWKGYTRAGFVKAVHMGDSLYILAGQFAGVTKATFDTTAIHKAIADRKYDKKYIVNLQQDTHKLVTWSMRFVNPEMAANEVEADRAFLMESQKAEGESDIAPVNGQWLKMQNGCIVLSGTAGAPSSFDQFTGADDALIFNVDKGSKEDLATENETITASTFSVIAKQGAVEVIGAAGKNVVITNILGQVIANTVLTSDNATIAASAGVVVVAVEGEDAVKAIIK